MMTSKLTAAIVCALTVFLPTAKAYSNTSIEENTKFNSPQRFMLEIKFGPYRPDVDGKENYSNLSSADSSPPFQKIYGDGNDLMIQGEFDWEIWRGFGTVGIGGQVGYFNTSASPLKDNSDGIQLSTSNERSAAGETSLKLLPLAVLGLYRLDYFADRFRFPLVPFFKFGFNYTIWWSTAPDGSVESFDGEKAMGGTFGWQINAGVSFLLDVLEPSAAKNLDVDLGINHTYIFFEFVHVAADGLGADNKLHVGDTTWQGGIAFEF